ncbi:MAG: hypothetical protein IH612_16790 [Desulfofustis sp.]|nr:hypothetical protein [Desulfofustis sp.]
MAFPFLDQADQIDERMLGRINAEIGGLSARYGQQRRALEKRLVMFFHVFRSLAAKHRRNNPVQPTHATPSEDVRMSFGYPAVASGAAGAARSAAIPNYPS